MNKGASQKSNLKEEKVQVSAVEHCKKLAGEKSYLIELLQDGWKTSIKEERNVNTENMLVDPLLQQTISQVQAVRVLWQEDRCWACVEISRELGIAASIAHTLVRKKHLCSYVLNIFLGGGYYLLNVRNSECILKILLF